MRPALASLAAGLLVLAACGGAAEEPPPPTLPADALPKLSSEARRLDRSALAADALRPGDLSRFLREAGYVEGVEREFFGRSDTFDRVVARGLRFEDAEGADAYLRWVRAHGRDLVGPTELRRPLDLGSSPVLLALVPCATCKKELPTYLAAWRRGEVVFSLLASGRGVNRERFAALAGELDDRMEA